MNRADMLARAADRREPWDVAVIGGGATGVGVAVDAAARGYSVLLVERGDFGAGTSSRSTKLVHGGVRYLRQGHIGLVLDALRERGRLRRNAPHLVRDLPFVLPCYRRRDVAMFGVGLTAYDLLAGRERFGRSRVVSAAGVRRRLPTVEPTGLRGGVVYHDGQFDDSRLLIALVHTAADKGAVVLNYAPVVALTRGASGAINGLVFRDTETGHEYRVSARAVVNAAGPFCDDVRQLADPHAAPILAASRGSHVVLPRAFLPTDHALLVPNTPDGRVLFAIPWHGHTVVGTTDVEVPVAEAEPRASGAEIDFILETAGRYLATPPTRRDILATFAGIRPLVKGDASNTAKLSRDHAIRVDAPGLLTITGGKWTTYRSMAEDAVTRAAVLAGLPRRPCRTADLPVHGHHTDAVGPLSPFAPRKVRSAHPSESAPMGEAGAPFAERKATMGDLTVYGSDAPAVQSLAAAYPDLGAPLHPDLPYLAAEVVWAARFEMARTVEDVLARRTRALVLNAAAALAAAPRVAKLLAAERGLSDEWAAEQVRAFGDLARSYLPPSG